ncbi:MAG: hypothetical protein FJ356_00705 [Thaumarchaeota archaeon]|nr:hypothetical protein [Nitrososphaerota archaeon]
MSDYFDDIKKLIEENKWIEMFLKGQGYCIICGHDDPLDLEYHGPARERNIPDFLISCCRNCHGRFSRKQRYWPKESLRYKNPSDLKKAFLLLGLADVFKEKARKVFDEYGIA